MLISNRMLLEFGLTDRSRPAQDVYRAIRRDSAAC